MNQSVIITIYTQVYNTKPYIRQCVESVLHQTYPHFEYYLVDNGSTDGCKEILEEYAAMDQRIKLIRHEKNTIPPLGAQISRQKGIGRYYTTLDSDDWWEPDYLERLLAFAEKNNLDIACTGTAMHVMETGVQSFRRLEQPLILQKAAFAETLPWYYAFFRPYWAKLIRIECVRSVLDDSIPPLFYGYDTAWCFQTLRHVERIGIDNLVLHHYRIFSKSLSYQYNPDRFHSDIYLYNDAIDFLSSFGPVSIQNRNFLQCVYVNALTDTINVIQNSNLSPAGKLREYRTIAEHPITRAAYRECTDDAAAQSRKNLLLAALQAGSELQEEGGGEDLRFVLQTFLPRCGQAVFKANAPMFLNESQLLRALLQDDPRSVLQNLLERIKKNQAVRKYMVPETIQLLAIDHPLLYSISDTAFLRSYADIYMLVWQNKKLEALERMTGILLAHQMKGGKETFLTLYISLAAALEEPSAFLFGKLQLAWLLLRQNRLSECRAAADSLAEMGLDNEEFNALCLEIDRAKKK